VGGGPLIVFAQHALCLIYL